eukprot:gene3442-9930_t
MPAAADTLTDVQLVPVVGAFVQQWNASNPQVPVSLKEARIYVEGHFDLDGGALKGRKEELHEMLRAACGEGEQGVQAPAKSQVEKAQLAWTEAARKKRATSFKLQQEHKTEISEIERQARAKEVQRFVVRCEVEGPAVLQSTGVAASSVRCVYAAGDHGKGDELATDRSLARCVLSATSRGSHARIIVQLDERMGLCWREIGIRGRAYQTVPATIRDVLVTFGHPTIDLSPSTARRDFFVMALVHLCALLVNVGGDPMCLMNDGTPLFHTTFHVGFFACTWVFSDGRIGCSPLGVLLPPVAKRRARAQPRGAVADDSSSGSDDGAEIDLPAVPQHTLVELLKAALQALVKQVDLEIALWPAVPTREQQLASTLVDFTADRTEGPVGYVKCRAQRAKNMEEEYMWAALVANRATIPKEWVDALPLKLLIPRLRRIVRAWERRSATAARNAARVARWRRDRDCSSNTSGGSADEREVGYGSRSSSEA